MDSDDRELSWQRIISENFAPTVGLILATVVVGMGQIDVDRWFTLLQWYVGIGAGAAGVSAAGRQIGRGIYRAQKAKLAPAEPPEPPDGVYKLENGTLTRMGVGE